jgi:hypothetical protein
MRGGRVGAAGQHDRHARPARCRRWPHGQVFQLLGQHVAAFQVGHQQDVGLPGHRRDDALDAGGGSGHGVVEGQRPVEHCAFDLAAVGHLAQRGGIERGRHGRVHGFHRGQQRHFGHLHANHPRQIDGVAQDVGFLHQIRRDVDGRIGDDERARVGGRLHQEAMADAALGAQPGSGGDHGAHQFVGMQAAFHQRLDLAATGQFDCARRGVAVRHVLDAPAGQVQPGVGGHCFQLCARGDQYRLDQLGLRRFDGGFQRFGAARVHHGHADGAERADLRDPRRSHRAFALCQAEIGQRAACKRDRRVRRVHYGLAFEHAFAVAAQRDGSACRVAGNGIHRGDSGGHRERILHGQRGEVMQFKTFAAQPGPGNSVPSSPATSALPHRPRPKMSRKAGSSAGPSCEASTPANSAAVPASPRG